MQFNQAIEGKKDDTGKNRLDLIPVDSLWELGKVYSMGAAKYDDRNWEKGLKYSRVFAALLRHAWKWFSGEKYDSEDGQQHLASVAWCALALIHYDLNLSKYATLDDRPKDHVRVWQQGNAKPLSEGLSQSGQAGLSPLSSELQKRSLTGQTGTYSPLARLDYGWPANLPQPKQLLLPFESKEEATRPSCDAKDAGFGPPR